VNLQLKVERDILEDQEVQNKEFSPPKRFRYQETHSSGGSNLKFNRNMRSLVIPASRHHGGTGNIGGFLHGPQSISSPRSNLTRNPWCPKYPRNHVAIVFKASNVSYVTIL